MLLHIDHLGLSACCRAEKLVLWNELSSSTDPMNAFSSLHQKMLSGEKAPACWSCWQDEDNQKVSLRQRFGQNLPQLLDIERVSTHGPSMIEITLDRICHLSCRMCSSRYSSSWDPAYRLLHQNKQRFSALAWEEIEAIHQIDRSVPPLSQRPEFWQILERYLPRANMLNLSGGEPLHHPHHSRILEMCRQNDVDKVSYFTSLNISSKQMATLRQQWSHFSQVVINLSADHIYEDYDKFRIGGSFSSVVTHLKDLRKHLKNIYIKVPIVVQAYNIDNLPSIFQFWNSQDVDEVQLKHLTGPEFLSTSVIPMKDRGPIIQNLKAMISSADKPSPTLDFLNKELQILERVDKSHLHADYLVYNEVLDQHFLNSRHRYKVAANE